MTMKSNPLAKYERKWVAITKDLKKVLASDTDAKKLHEKVLKMKIGDKVMLMWVPPFDASLAPNAAV